MATHPSLTQLQKHLGAALRTSLDSHRYALKLDPENADTLFNTSQVLVASAEEMANDGDAEDAEALSSLQEAVELLNKCLAIQESRRDDGSEQRPVMAKSDPTLDDTSPVENVADKVASRGSSEEQWATIVEPVTLDTLADTILAAVAALTTFCSILSNDFPLPHPSALSWAEKHWTGIAEKICLFSHCQPDKVQEIALARANFISTFMEASFRSGLISSEVYQNERDAAFEASELGLESSSEALIANARALMSFNSALAESQMSAEQPGRLLPARWRALKTSIANLTTASHIRGIDQEVLASTHLLRGDICMLLFVLGCPPTSFEPATKEIAQFSRNAAIYYQNSGRLSTESTVKDVGMMRSRVAGYIRDSTVGQRERTPSWPAISGGPDWEMEQLAEMREEGLLPKDFVV